MQTDEDLLAMKTIQRIDLILPGPVNELIKSVRLRLGRDFGLDKIIVKNNTMNLHIMEGKKDNYFLSPVFKSLIQFAQNHPKRCKIKEQKEKLIFSISQIDSLNDSFHIFSHFKRN